MKCASLLTFGAMVLVRSLWAAGPPTPVHVLAPAGLQAPGVDIALSRLQTYGGFTAEVANTGAATATSGTTIVLGTPKDDPELRRAWTAHADAPADSYLIKTVSRTPLRLLVSGVNPRGTLFAAYELADRLKAGAALEGLDVYRQPKVAERFASFGATMYGRRVYAPEQHWKTVGELPDFGYNGVVIYPGGGTPIGRRSSPVMEDEDGTLRLDPANTAKWRAWFAELRKYQLELMMTVPPVIPPGYTAKAIADYYAGGEEPAGYRTALQSHFREYLQLLTTAYPDLDKFMFNSTEGATFGRNERFFGPPNLKRFPLERYRQNNEAVMRAYFDVLADFFKADRSRVYFWTHSFGLTSDGIRAMREVLFSYPWVTIIEDDYWNNNLWPMDLPAMAYLPADLRAEVPRRNPFALFQIATDGEYYGGGSLPTAYPGSHVRSAREAVDDHARMVIQRLDLHARTPYGTAFGIMKIVPYAASRQLWTPTPNNAEIWAEWAATRFGQAAAPHVIRALQESHEVLREGLSGNGFDLLVVGSEFSPAGWEKDKAGMSRFNLFGRPGRALLQKPTGEPVLSGEYTVYETDTHAMSIADFRAREERAQAAVRRGLAEIELAKPDLAPADYAMLRDVFTQGQNVLEAVRLLGDTAYATNLVLDNFDHVTDPEEQFRQAAGRLEAFLHEQKLIPEMTKNLATILRSYRALVAHP